MLLVGADIGLPQAIYRELLLLNAVSYLFYYQIVLLLVPLYELLLVGRQKCVYDIRTLLQYGPP